MLSGTSQTMLYTRKKATGVKNYCYFCQTNAMTIRMLMKLLFTLLMLAMPMVAAAQNPIIRNQFAADPTARVFNNKVYLYPSHDIAAPEDYPRKDWFCMADYHVFSSENLIDWTDHGIIVEQENVPWGKPDGYSMWAPDCVERNGKYYFYFPDAPREGRGFAIGVATALRPEGPFTLEKEPIKGVMGIDPCVLVDRPSAERQQASNDGQAYIYWSGMGLRGAKLKDNMKEIDGEAMLMEGLPEGFKEGPFVFRRGDWYYLTFPWVRGDTTNGKNPTETLAYAMSKNPLGPWDFKGIIMAEHANHCWTNHHSIVEYKGQWYLFYHHNDYSPAMDKRRSPHIDKIAFRPDGTIIEVKPTLRGVGTVPATHRIEIDRYTATSGLSGKKSSLGAAGNDSIYCFNNPDNPFLGWHAKLTQKGQWVSFADVDFGMLEAGAYVVANVKASQNSLLTLHANDAKGPVIARMELKVEATGQFRRDQRDRWITVSVPLANIPKGVATLCLVSETEGHVSIDWLQFKNHEKYFTPVSADAQALAPDSDGFIRRWTVLEPIPQEIRSNVVFTDSWLREAFSKSYFKNQLTVVPRDGQKAKTGAKTLSWHTIDSERYNLKLFRFAEQWGQQTYGNLFWIVTVIDCPEDIPNVRLAAGSNGASVWWVNGEEVLLLSGDRRMVRDDGVSNRIGLKKGRNILRCAVINGPGMSDLCARFIDEKGNAVRNFNIP